MRKRVPVVLALVGGALGLCSAALEAQVCEYCPSYEKLGTPAARNLAGLVGCWIGKGPGGLATEVSYELGSDDTALLETLWVESNPTMYTMYYLDGETPMAHHFCSYGNQIRMRAEPSSDPDVLAFKFLDATNLADEDHNHMTHVTFTFHDQDRFDVEWGLHRDGEDLPQPFIFKRVVEGCEPRDTEDWRSPARAEAGRR